MKQPMPIPLSDHKPAQTSLTSVRADGLRGATVLPHPRVIQDSLAQSQALAEVKAPSFSAFLPHEQLMTRRGLVAAGDLRIGDDILTRQGFSPLRELGCVANELPELMLRARNRHVKDFTGHPHKLTYVSGWQVELLTGLHGGLIDMRQGLCAAHRAAISQDASVTTAAALPLLRLVFDTAQIIFTTQGLFASHCDPRLPAVLTSTETRLLLRELYHVDE